MPMMDEQIFLSMLTGGSLLFGIFSGILNLRKGTRREAGKNAAEMTMVIVKPEDISNGVSEIKADLSNVKGDIRELTERLIVAEQTLKQTQHRLSDLEKHER